MCFYSFHIICQSSSNVMVLWQFITAENLLQSFLEEWGLQRDH